MVELGVLKLPGELTVRGVLTMLLCVCGSSGARLWSSIPYPSFSWPFLTLNVPAISFVYPWLCVLGSIHISLPNLRLLFK